MAIRSRIVSLILIIAVLYLVNRYYYSMDTRQELPTLVSSHIRLESSLLGSRHDELLPSTPSSAYSSILHDVDSEIVLQATKFRPPSGGYVLANNYFEQQTCASRNLLGLQCWSTKLKLHPVEPFMTDSFLHSPRKEKEMRFSDILNFKLWNTLSRKKGFAPLVTWEQFLSGAPRNLITVMVMYDSQNIITGKSKSGQGCLRTEEWSNQLELLKTFNFNVVSDICIDFTHGKKFGVDEFHKEIYGMYDPSKSTVLFQEWPGFSRNRFRVPDLESRCGVGLVTDYAITAEPSTRILNDVNKYTKRYLNSSGYVAIVSRIEKVIVRMGKKSVALCYEKTKKYWDKMVDKVGINTTFMSSDVGRFGSKSFDSTTLIDSFSKLFYGVYNNTFTIKQWEDTFEESSGVSDSGYVAMLQKVLASRAKCILFLGGASFQRNILQLYKDYHPRNEWCIYIVESCTIKYDLTLS